MIVVDMPKVVGTFINRGLIARIREHSEELADYLEGVEEGDPCTICFNRDSKFIRSAFGHCIASEESGVSLHRIFEIVEILDYE